MRMRWRKLTRLYSCSILLLTDLLYFQATALLSFLACSSQSHLQGNQNDRKACLMLLDLCWELNHWETQWLRNSSSISCSPFPLKMCVVYHHMFNLPCLLKSKCSFSTHLLSPISHAQTPSLKNWLLLFSILDTLNSESSSWNCHLWYWHTQGSQQTFTRESHMIDFSNMRRRKDHLSLLRSQELLLTNSLSLLVWLC